MNTTNVFVELLVIGLGPLTALLLVILIVLNPGAGALAGLLDSASSLAVLVPMLAATYILGIVADRLADHVFGRFASRVRHRYFETDDDYHDARRSILYYAEPIYRLRQYGRSRLRICRGWAAMVILTFVGTALSWRALAHSEYRKIKGGAEFIRGELEDGASPGLRLHD